MYYYLTGAIKRRIIRELKDCFQGDLRHNDILPHIRHKYDFEERPQKGIVVQGASANTRVLSSDNFIGTVMSHVMLAQIDRYPGRALEWVKDDWASIRDNGEEFPSPPGIYYIEMDSDLDPDGYERFKFHVDPLLSVFEEPLLEFSTGTESSAFLMHSPVIKDTVRLYVIETSGNHRQLLRGKGLRITADESLTVGPVDEDTVRLGLPEGDIPPVVMGSQTGPFAVQVNDNDHLRLWANGVQVDVTLTSGNRTTGEVAQEIADALASALPQPDWEVADVGGAIRIRTTRTLRFASDDASTANSLLGYDAGFVPVVAEGAMLKEWIPDIADFRLVVDGALHQFPLDAGRRSAENIRDELEANLQGAAVVELYEAGDYAVDPDAGEVTFLHDFDPGQRVYADYKYPINSTENIPVERNTANNTAIPGCVLAFGDQLQKGDKMAVVVNPEIVDAASAYGGKWEVSVDMDIIARDAATREELSDRVMMYFFMERKEELAEEGLVIDDVSFGGETEETYDETADTWWFRSSVSLTLLADWEVHIPRPLWIETVTPVSFEEQAEAVLEDRVPEVDGLQMVEDTQIPEARGAYIKGRTSNFERLR